MKYHVRFLRSSKRQYDKLDNADRLAILEKLSRLAEDAKTGKPIGKGFRELKHKSFRIYYSIESKFVVIEEISYDGTVTVHRVGKKRHQKNDIRDLMRLVKRKTA